MSLNNIEQEDITRQAKLLQYANMKRINGEFNDVTIQAGAERISANRMVLACFSKFFESMFLSPLKEKYQNTVEIKEFDGEAVKAVIEFIYSGKIEINSNNVLALLRTADFLQVDDVKKMCFDFLETTLTVDSCLDALKSSVLYNNPSPLQQTYQFISDNFDEIVKTDNFNHLSNHDLTTLFSNIYSCSVQARSMYTAIMNWVKHDEKRETEFSSLFLTLDLEKLPSEFVIETVIKEPLITSNIDCLNAVVSYMADCIKLAKEPKKASKILCVGGDRSKSVTEIYDISGKSLKTYPDLSNNMSGHSVLKLDNFVYSIGGLIGRNFEYSSDKVSRLNLKEVNSEWKEMASMSKLRSNFGACVYSGSLVVAGGCDSYGKTNSAEVYEPRMNRWREIASMNTKRDKFALVVAENRIFAVGGSDSIWNAFSSVEQLDNLEGKWKEIASMNEGRRFLAAVTCGGFVYALGGIRGNDNKVVKSVEKYDLNISKWSFVESMNMDRFGHAACVLEGKIFVIGGRDHQDNMVTSIECYNPVTDDWTIIGETNQELHQHAVVAL